jgi:hypothetical protein
MTPWYQRHNPETDGRALNDDVVDFSLNILTNGKVRTDNIGQHTDLLSEFPYVSIPQRAK